MDIFSKLKKEFNADKFKIDDYEWCSIEKLEQKHKNFYAPSFKLLLEEKDAVELGMEITDISVTNPIDSADQFSFNVNNAFDITRSEFKWIDQYFKPGQKVEISMGYSASLEPLIFGQINSVTYEFPQGGYPQISVRGLDISSIMMEGKVDRPPWEKRKISDVVDEIAKEYKIPDTDIENTGTVLELIRKSEVSDFEFILNLAKEIDYDFFVFGNKLYFKPKSIKKEPVVTLKWGMGLMSFSPEVNVSGQVSKVKVIGGWNVDAKEPYTGVAASVDKIGEGGSKTVVEYMKEIRQGRDVEEVIHRFVSSQEQADTLAKAILNKKSGNFFTGKAETIGLPEIRAGRFVKLEGLGKLFNKVYFVESTTHSLNSSGYRTSFSVRSNTL